jgi:hypothetical protein
MLESHQISTFIAMSRAILRRRPGETIELGSGITLTILSVLNGMVEVELRVRDGELLSQEQTEAAQSPLLKKPH